MNAYLIATFGVGGGPQAISTLGFFGGAASLTVAVLQASNEVSAATLATRDSYPCPGFVVSADPRVWLALARHRHWLG